MIIGHVRGQELKLDRTTIAADSIKYLEAEFHFAGRDWDGYVKTAYFINGTSKFALVLADDRITADMGLNLTAGEWEVKLSGVKGGSRITTTTEHIYVREFGSTDGTLPDVTATQAEQILAKIGDLANLTTEDKTNLVAAINEAAKSGGGSNGGKDGTGIASITYKGKDEDGGNVYTVLLTDGSSYDITAPKGATGADGITPTIGTNGNWFVGDTDTGKPSRGEKGESGGSSVTITDDEVTAERAYAAAATPKSFGANKVIPSGNTLKFVAAQDGILKVENASLLSYSYVNIALPNANGQPLYSVTQIDDGFELSKNPNYTLNPNFSNGKFAFPANIQNGKKYTLRWYGSNSYIFLVKTVDGSMTAGQKLVESSTSNGAHVAQFEADAQYAGIRFAVDVSNGRTANITKITLAEGDTAAEYTPSGEVKQVNVTAGKSYYLSGVKNKSVFGPGTFYSAPDAVLTVNGVSPTGGDVKTYATTKTFVCFGDSIWTFGTSTGGIGTISDYMERLCGGTWHNIATGGSTMANRPGSYAGDYDAFDFHALADCVASGDFSAPKAAASGLTTNIANVDAVTWADVDVITIAYGTNDLAFGGTLDNDNNLYDKATVCGALRYGIKTIAAAYPNIKFMVLGILYRNADSVDVKTISEWNDGLRKTAEMMGAEYVPMIGINAGNSGTYLYDGTHPNAAGKEAIAKSVAKHVLNI